MSKIEIEDKKIVKKGTITLATLGTALELLSNGLNIASLFINNAKEETVTEMTLEKYNTYLENMESEERLTEDDLAYIYQSLNEDILNIRLKNGKYVQVYRDNYNIIENEKRQIELISDNNYTAYTSGQINIFENVTTYDLFTNTRLTNNQERYLVSSIGEYIDTNQIESMGYKEQEYLGWKDSDVEFIRTNYSEDILDCLKENGFPILAYDVSDFYETHKENKETNSIELKRNLQFIGK